VKIPHHAPSATSLPRAPRDEAGARSTRYLVMMGIRIVCFVLMVVITPYGWYTWVLGAAAILLPYVAVVSANVGQDSRGNRREDPEPSLPATPTSPAPGARVIRIEETPATAPASPSTPADPPAQPDRPEHPDRGA
jgi:hypothetical protein